MDFCAALSDKTYDVTWRDRTRRGGGDGRLEDGDYRKR